MNVPFHKPYILKEEIDSVVESLESCWLTTGPKTKQFESDFSEYLGIKNAIAVNSCTAALHLALEAIDLKEGEEVITTPMTFAATAEVIRYFNARPVLADIEHQSMNIDVSKLEETIKKRSESGCEVKAIIPVHFGGHPCEMSQLMDLAVQYGVKVVEDAAHALPACYENSFIGGIGDITCFSFYATKTITTGEGGMVTTENDEYAERMRVMSLHGIDKNAWNRYSAEGNWYYEIVSPGFKYNMTDIAASLGIAQLKKVDFLLHQRERIAKFYDSAFSEIEQIQTPSANKNIQHSWHLYVIRLNLEKLTIDRNQFIEQLRSIGVGTSVHFIPLHLHPYYQKKYGYKPEDFPVAFDCYQRMISLPIFPGMTDIEIEYVIEAVVDTANKHKK